MEDTPWIDQCKDEQPGAPPPNSQSIWEADGRGTPGGGAGRLPGGTAGRRRTRHPAGSAAAAGPAGAAAGLRCTLAAAENVADLRGGALLAGAVERGLGTPAGACTCATPWLHCCAGVAAVKPLPASLRSPGTLLLTMGASGAAGASSLGLSFRAAPSVLGAGMWAALTTALVSATASALASWTAVDAGFSMGSLNGRRKAGTASPWEGATAGRAPLPAPPARGGANCMDRCATL
jgi:hypothetical protein